MSGLDEYRGLIDAYHELVDNGQWWVGQRELLAKRMDEVWGRLSLRQREEALRYAEEVWKKRRGI